MFTEFYRLLTDWHPWDTDIVLTAMVASMSCALPGVWLVLRRQSMMGDALSHTALPGVVIAFLFAHWMTASGWLSEANSLTLQPLILAAGAVVLGVLTAVLTEWIQKLGNVESSAALGVVFTTLFALGLLLIRLYADDVHIDPDCVLFGQLELVVWNHVRIFGIEFPHAFVINAVMLLVNLGLLTLFYKELRVATFDPGLATALGINARVMNYGLMSITAVTVVMAFQSVGSILVIGLLIVPAACAVLLCNRLITMIGIALTVAALSAALGHAMAKTLPSMLFSRLGLPAVKDAGTSGMIAVACGMIFMSIFLFSPHHGILGKWLGRLRLSFQIAADDFLSTLYRFQEQEPQQHISETRVRTETPWIGDLLSKLTFWNLKRQGLVMVNGEGFQLTSLGMQRAASVVRSHRLWETYMQKHFDIPDDHLHETAHYVEHYLDQELRQQLEEELESPGTDPHGREIPEH